MMDVVPPTAAARVPVSKSSELTVPPNGSCMCTCGSIPPGTTNFPAASIVRSATIGSAVPMAVTASPSMNTSAT